MTDIGKLFWNEHRAWSNATFGTVAERGPMGPLKHLRKEVNEAIASMHATGTVDPIEIVDCLFLTFDAWARTGRSYEDLFDLAMKKLAINRARTWPKPTSDEPVEHVREESSTLGALPGRCPVCLMEFAAVEEFVRHVAECAPVAL